MIIGLLFAVLSGAVLWGVLRAAGLTRGERWFPRVIMGGFVLRLLIQFAIRDVPFFSHGLGGDSAGYEAAAQAIAQYWTHSGVHFVTSNEMADLGPTSLPANVFALIIYLNGGDVSRLGCTAVVALAAALTVINIYTLAIQLGAKERNALLLATLFFLQPAFLFYTSDTYKDGLVLCFTIGAFGSALRLSLRLSVVHLVIGVLSVAALWFVRFYLLSVAIAPLIVGIVGLGGKGVTRSVVAALVLGTGLLALAGFTDILQLASSRAAETFDLATSQRVIGSNSEGGSGVTFDDGGSPFGALPAKLIYTIFSPFPWSAGSLGFQLGKVDAFLWYFMLYRAARAARTVDKRVLLMVATFVLPSTLMYAMSMANVGLIVRQRLIIVAAVAILASLWSPKKLEIKTRPQDAISRLPRHPRRPVRRNQAA
jgi:hypothetical protein